MFEVSLRLALLFLDYFAGIMSVHVYFSAIKKTRQERRLRHVRITRGIPYLNQVYVGDF